MLTVAQLLVSFEWHLVEFLQLVQATVPFVEYFEEVIQFLCDTIETLYSELASVQVFQRGRRLL